MIRWTPDGEPPRHDDPPGPGLVLDRDGCLTVEGHHLTDPDDLVPEAGAQDAVRRAAAAGLRVAVVTNQSVVGRGLVSADTMLAMHVRLAALFPAIEAIYHCPHRAGQGCTCRKPRPRMPAAAVADLGLDPTRTVMVGDKVTDAGAGRAASLDVMLVRTGHGSDEADQAAAVGIPVVDSLVVAIDRILAD